MLAAFCLSLPALQCQEMSINPAEYSLAASGVDLRKPLPQPVQFVDLGIDDVLQILEEFTGKSILRQSDLKQVNLSYRSNQGDRVGDVIIALESLLSLNGVSVTPVGEHLLKAVAKDKMLSQAPMLIDGSTLGLPPSEQIYSTFFTIRFLSQEEAAKILTPFLSGGELVLSSKGDTLLATDALVNLQRMESVLARLDKPSADMSAMIVYQPNFVVAEELASALSDLAKGGLKSQLAKEPVFESDKRTNQLIVFTDKANESLIRNLLHHLDKDVAPLTSTEIYNIRHATAEEIVTLVQQVINRQKEIKEDEGATAKKAAEQAPAAISNGNDASGESLQFSKYVSLVPDKRANTILATGTAGDHKYLHDLIGKMDVFLPQVRIEVLIAEVNLNKDEASGIQKLGLLYKKTADAQLIGGESPVKNIDNAYGWISDSISYGTGIALGPLAENPLDSFQLVLDTARSNDDVNVLSAPTVMTTHNRKATIVISTRRPIITSTNSYTDTTNVSASVQYQDIGLELTVTPLIGSNDIIQMDIEQKYENVVGQLTINGNQQPIIGSRRTNSYVSVSNGQLVVLGGLQSVNENTTNNKMAILGDIPILGEHLFTYKSTSDARSELLILVRPKILRSTDEINEDANKSIELFHNKQDIDVYRETGTFTPVEDDEKKDVAPRFQPKRKGKSR